MNSCHKQKLYFRDNSLANIFNIDKNNQVTSASFLKFTKTICLVLLHYWLYNQHSTANSQMYTCFYVPGQSNTLSLKLKTSHRRSTDKYCKILFIDTVYTIYFAYHQTGARFVIYTLCKFHKRMHRHDTHKGQPSLNVKHCT